MDDLPYCQFEDGCSMQMYLNECTICHLSLCPEHLPCSNHRCTNMHNNAGNNMQPQMSMQRNMQQQQPPQQQQQQSIPQRRAGVPYDHSLSLSLNPNNPNELMQTDMSPDLLKRPSSDLLHMNSSNIGRSLSRVDSGLPPSRPMVSMNNQGAQSLSGPGALSIPNNYRNMSNGNMFGSPLPSGIRATSNDLPDYMRSSSGTLTNGVAGQLMENHSSASMDDGNTNSNGVNMLHPSQQQLAMQMQQQQQQLQKYPRVTSTDANYMMHGMNSHPSVQNLIQEESINSMRLSSPPFSNPGNGDFHNPMLLSSQQPSPHSLPLIHGPSHHNTPGSNTSGNQSIPINTRIGSGSSGGSGSTPNGVVTPEQDALSPNSGNNKSSAPIVNGKDTSGIITPTTRRGNGSGRLNSPTNIGGGSAAIDAVSTASATQSNTATSVATNAIRRSGVVAPSTLPSNMPAMPSTQRLNSMNGTGGASGAFVQLAPTSREQNSQYHAFELERERGSKVTRYLMNWVSPNQGKNSRGGGSPSKGTGNQFQSYRSTEELASNVANKLSAVVGTVGAVNPPLDLDELVVSYRNESTQFLQECGAHDRARREAWSQGVVTLSLTAAERHAADTQVAASNHHPTNSNSNSHTGGVSVGQGNQENSISGNGSQAGGSRSNSPSTRMHASSTVLPSISRLSPVPHPLLHSATRTIHAIADAFLMNELEIAVFSVYLDRVEPEWFLLAERGRDPMATIRLLHYVAFMVKSTFNSASNSHLYLPYLTSLYPDFSIGYSLWLHEKSGLQLGLPPPILNHRYNLLRAFKAHLTI